MMHGQKNIKSWKLRKQILPSLWYYPGR